MARANGNSRDSSGSSPESDSVSVSELAQILDITERRVQQLVREKVIKKSARGKYPFRESIRRYVAYLHAVQGDGSASTSDELRRENLRRVRRENDEADGLLLHRDELIEIVGSIMVQLATSLDQVDGQVAPDDTTLRNKIREEIRRARTEAVDELCRRFRLASDLVDPQTIPRSLS